MGGGAEGPTCHACFQLNCHLLVIGSNWNLMKEDNTRGKNKEQLGELPHVACSYTLFEAVVALASLWKMFFLISLPLLCMLRRWVRINNSWRPVKPAIVYHDFCPKCWSIQHSPCHMCDQQAWKIFADHGPRPASSNTFHKESGCCNCFLRPHKPFLFPSIDGGKAGTELVWKSFWILDDILSAARVLYIGFTFFLPLLLQQPEKESLLFLYNKLSKNWIFCRILSTRLL